MQVRVKCKNCESNLELKPADLTSLNQLEIDNIKRNLIKMETYANRGVKEIKGWFGRTKTVPLSDETKQMLKNTIDAIYRTSNRKFICVVCGKENVI